MAKLELPIRYFSVAMLARRWECADDEIYQLIDTGYLRTVPRVAAANGCRGIIFHVYEINNGEDFPILCHIDSHLAVEDQKHNGPIEDNVYIDVSCENSFRCKEALQEKIKELEINGGLDPVITSNEVSRFEYDHDEADHEKTRIPKSQISEFLTTRDVARIFKDINGWSFHKWMKTLGDPPKWMKPAMISCGGPPRPNRWNPIELSRILMSRNVVDLMELNKRFMNDQRLQPWSPEWQSYADHIEKS